jgi:excinuclease UvrABC ATPase subunit
MKADNSSSMRTPKPQVDAPLDDAFDITGANQAMCHSKNGNVYEMAFGMERGRTIVTECACRYFRFFGRCRHCRGLQAQFDMDEKQTILDALSSAKASASIAAAAFETAWWDWKLGRAGGAACNEACHILEAARQRMRKLIAEEEERPPFPFAEGIERPPFPSNRSGCDGHADASLRVTGINEGGEPMLERVDRA